MEPITREQMVAEFGEPGVQNPKIMDLIEMDSVSEKVVLVMIERRAWDGGLSSSSRSKRRSIATWVMSWMVIWPPTTPSMAASASGFVWTASRSLAARRSDSCAPRTMPFAPRASSSS
jgi:hypothetical protein